MSFAALRQRFGRLRFTLIVLAAAVLCVWVGYEVGNARLGFLHAERERLTERTQRLQRMNEQLEYQTNILRVERDVDRVAIENLQAQLRQSHDDTAAIRRELAFFQRVMAPELDADGVSIDSLTITPASDGVFHFRLILLQLERTQENLVTGGFRITLRGSRDGESSEYDVLELAGVEHDNGERSFAMNYFNRLDGTFRLPDDLSPESISVEIRVRGGRQVSQQFPWGELVGDPEVPLQLNQDDDQLGVGR
ncbi:MAG: hypothetical protein JJU03_10175 [Idiomarina sp.]|nr:hypothetical protein [Idiomarina sp.]